MGPSGGRECFQVSTCGLYKALVCPSLWICSNSSDRLFSMFLELIEPRGMVSLSNDESQHQCIFLLFTWFSEKPMFTVKSLHFELFICYCLIKK
jgi:hypothetical protein